MWGNTTHAPDDEPDSAHSHGELIAFRDSTSDGSTRNMSAVDAGTWILEHTPTTFQKMLATNYSFGIERDEQKLAENDNDPTKWSNPLEIRCAPYHALFMLLNRFLLGCRMHPQ